MKRFLIAFLILSTLVIASSPTNNKNNHNDLSNYFITIEPVDADILLLPVKNIEWIEIFIDSKGEVSATITAQNRFLLSATSTVKGKEKVDKIIKQIKMINNNLIKNEEELLNGKESI